MTLTDDENENQSNAGKESKMTFRGYYVFMEDIKVTRCGKQYCLTSAVVYYLKSQVIRGRETPRSDQI